MRKKEDEKMIRLFQQMNEKDRKWFLSMAADTVRESASKQPLLRLVVNSRTSS